MPSSYWRNIPDTLGAILAARPRTVLDVGIGRGKYGALAREYIGRLRRLDGVEIWPAYLTWQWALYDRIYIGDVAELELPAYDLVLLVDIVEHFELEASFRVVERLGARARQLVISTPHRLFQTRYRGPNVHETHRCRWTVQTLADLCERNGWTYAVVPNRLSLIATITT